MLKKFFLNLLSSFVGAWIALLGFGVLIFFLIIGFIAKVGISSASEEKVSKHSILKISLQGEIRESESPADFNYMNLLHGDIERPQTLKTLVKSIEYAKENKDIEAVYLECNGVSAGFATLDILRKTLIDFKKNGKKIYAYSDAYTTPDYYLASCADSVFINGNGSVDLKGIASMIPYMKGLFDKIGVQFQVVKVGTFKSAVEPYILENMSEPARAQLDTLYGNIWNYMKNGIAESRKLKSGTIDSLINRDYITYAEAEQTVKSGLTDKVVSAREMDAILAGLVGVEKKKLNIVSPSVVSGQSDWSANFKSKKQIAVLYAVGDIQEESPDGINCKNLVPEIVSLAEDENVKGLVLRVNSPGGSVFGSSEIAEALNYFKSKGKTFSVSMGDYAASGGYWISADAERIFADPLTVTGSIGIFGMIPNIMGLGKMLGVNMEMVCTDPAAVFPTLFKPMDDKQMSVMQSYIDRGYDKFIKRVAKGRNMKESKVRSIAEGRVWDGMTAKKIGLVDELGSLDDAVKWTAKKAKLGDSYDVVPYPKTEPSFWDYIPDSKRAYIVTLVTDAFGDKVDTEILKHAVHVVTRKPVQARMIPLDMFKMN